MKDLYRFKETDEIKEYGIKEYFDEAMKSADRIKSIGIVTSDEYRFYTFDSKVNHIVYTRKYSEDNHENKIMFLCDNETNLTLSFEVCRQGEIPSVFIGKCIKKILEEYKRFLKENKDTLDFKKIKLYLHHNFYGNNEVYYRMIDLPSYEGFTSMIDAMITSIIDEINKAEEGLKEMKRKEKLEKNPVYKLLKKYF